ncbi:MAG TPA: hypothetical protein VIO81_14110 [Methyloversatilis sp.]
MKAVRCGPEWLLFPALAETRSTGALMEGGRMGCRGLAGLILAMALAGCGTRYVAIPASGVADHLQQPESALIIGRVLLRDGTRVEPDSSWINPSLHFAHAPAGADLPEQSRQHEGIMNYQGDFITSVTTDREGYFYYFLPPGRYKVNYVHPHGRPLLGFDVPRPGRTYYLGTLIFDKGSLANTLNDLTFPALADQSAQVAADLHEKLSGTLLAGLEKSAFHPLPCSFASIGFPPGEDHWSPPGNAAVGRGPVAITVSHFAPRTNIDPLTEGKRVASGKLAGAGVVSGATAGALVPLTDPVGWVFYPFIAPITITVGAVAGGTAGGVMGAAMGLDDDQVRKLDVAVGETFRGMPVQERLAGKIRAATQDVRTDVAVLGEAGPRSKGEDPDYLPLGNEGYKEFIEVSLIKAGLNVEKTDPVRLTLLLTMRLKFGAPEHADSAQVKFLEFTSRPAGFDGLVANKGAGLSAMLNDSLDLVGHCLAEALFPEVPAALSR